MQLFFTNNTEDQFFLESEESKHICKVLRKKEGENIYFTDGKGNLITTRIIDFNIKKTKIKVIAREKKKKKHKYFLHIAIAPTKNIQRYLWFLEKATEIGIDEITPIICNHSERKKINVERCNKILITAVKQSLKYHLPKLNKCKTLVDLLKDNFAGEKYIAHCQNTNKINLKETKAKENNLILIGPEGDFNQKEINLAIKNNFKAINLANNRLRTETAGIIAAHTINIKH